MSNKIDKYSGVVGVVYLDEEPKKFAITQNKRGYSVPGGGINKEDNSLEDAMYREIKEELGFLPRDVEIQKTNLEEKFKYDSGKDGRSNQFVIRPIFLIKAKVNNLKSQDKDILSAKWYRYDEAMNILTWDNAKDTFKRGCDMIK